VARLGSQHATREEAEAIRARLAEQNPDASWFVFPRDGGWVVAKADVKPSTIEGSTTAARPKPDVDDRRDGNLGNLPPLGGGPF
jgi:hypothetical protein